MDVLKDFKVTVLSKPIYCFGFVHSYIYCRCRFLPSSLQTGVYDAAVAYRTRNIPQLILAGLNYGIGASRDWAAKGLVALVSVVFVVLP